MNRAALHRLRLPLLAFMMALIAGALLCGATDAHKRHQQSLLATQQRLLGDARQRQVESVHEAALIHQYLPAYQRLRNNGFFAQDRPARWIRELREINQRHRLFGIDYAIGPQQEGPGMPGLEAGNFRMQRSTAKLSLALLHEQDLLTLLHALQGNGTGAPLVLRECLVERMGENTPAFVPAGGKNGPSPNLSAVCELQRLTVSEPAGKGGPS